MTATRPTNETLTAALASLGDTPQEVVASLAAAGITGIPHHPLCCPIAEFVRATFTESDAIVNHGQVFAGLAVADMGDAIGNFVGDFDDERPYTQVVRRTTGTEI